MAGARYVGRANVARRVAALDVRRSVYAGGSVRFETTDGAVTVTPPFGLGHEGDYEGAVVEPLLAALVEEHTVAALLVRLGGYAVGVYEGERLAASKVGARFVKGRHRAGGSSSNRFRRRREEQERELIGEAAAEAARVLGPWRGSVTHVALGGDRTAVGRTLAARPELSWLGPLALERFLDVPDPRRRTLEELPYRLYAAKVVEEPAPPQPAR